MKKYIYPTKRDFSLIFNLIKINIDKIELFKAYYRFFINTIYYILC